MTMFGTACQTNLARMRKRFPVSPGRETIEPKLPDVARDWSGVKLPQPAFSATFDHFAVRVELHGKIVLCKSGRTCPNRCFDRLVIKQNQARHDDRPARASRRKSETAQTSWRHASGTLAKRRTPLGFHRFLGDASGVGSQFCGGPRISLIAFSPCFTLSHSSSKISEIQMCSHARYCKPFRTISHILVEKLVE